MLQHFTEIIEDQFDFHTYCMRKMTLRSYVDLLRLVDVLRYHKFYERAANCAINVYLRLHDKPVTDDDKLNEMDTDNMDPSELKKLRNKQKKAKRKAEQEKQQQQQQQARKDLHNKSQRKANDEEMDSPAKDELVPDKLERPEDALAEALKFLAPLQMLAGSHLSTHVMAFEVYLRKGKPLLMLQAMKRALKCEVQENDPELHNCLVRFQNFVAQNEKKFAPAVKTVLDREAKAMFAGKTAKVRNDEFIKKNSKSLHHSFIGKLLFILSKVLLGLTFLKKYLGAKLMALLEPAKAESAMKNITNLESFTSGVDLQVRTTKTSSFKNPEERGLSGCRKGLQTVPLAQGIV